MKNERSMRPSHGREKRPSFAEPGATQIGTEARMTLAQMRMGIPNVTRRFTLETDPSNPDVFNTPSYFLQFVNPCASFSRGFSDDDTLLSHDDDFDEYPYLLDRDVSNIDHTFSAETAYANQFVDVVWPLMENLFESGIGSRFKTNINWLLKYYVNVMHSYCLAYQAVMINYLAYRFDWSKVTPFTSIVPPSLYELARDYEATDVGLAEKWFEVMQRTEVLSLPPALLRNIQRTLTPFLTMGLGPKLIIPIYRFKSDWLPWNWTPDDEDASPFEEALKSLNFIDSSVMEQTGNLIRNFLPFPVGLTGPWNPELFPLSDPARYVAMENCGLRNNNVYVDNSLLDWPALDEGIQWRQAENGQWGNLYYFSPSPTVTWDDISHCGAMAVGQSTLFNRSAALISPHNYHEIAVCSDTYDKSDDDTYLLFELGDTFNDVAARYYKVVPNKRWVTADQYDIDYGYLVDGSIVTQVPYEGALRMNRLAVESDWVYDAMRDLTYLGYGNSLREIRPVFNQLRQDLLGRI